MISEDLEFSISQYVDDTLSPEERVAVEGLIESNPEAQAALDEYRRLDVVLKSVPMPEIQWEPLAEAIWQNIEAQQEKSAAAFRMPAWVRAALPLALAASVLVAAALVLRTYSALPKATNAPIATVTPKPTDPAIVVPPVALAEATTIIVVGPADQVQQNPPDIQVAIGPGKTDDQSDDATLAHYNDDVTSRPSHLAIASGVIPEHDRLPVSFDMQ